MRKRILSLVVALAMVFGVTAGLTVFTASAADTGTVVRLDPSNASPFNNGEFQGWGTALCWWANRLGYSEELTQQAAKAFFSEEGLGLDIARYNLGGGDDPDHNHITRSDSKVPGVWETFKLSSDGKDVEEITYDITNDQNQLNIAKAALAANPNLYFEGFSNSAPYFMTVTGCTSGGTMSERIKDNKTEYYSNENNLNDDFYDDFAKFIADATNLFKKEGIVFQSYSPMNEPDTDYWFAGSGKQEGCHFSPGTSQSNMIVETRKALDAAGLNDVLVAGMDETSLKKTANNLGSLTTEAKAALGRVDTHTYSDRGYHAQVKAKALELGKNLWQSEVDKGGDGFTLASMIIEDMNGMQPSAWVMWDIVDRHRDSNFTAPDGSKPEASATLKATDELWGVGMGNHDTETLELANKYYFYGQFTRYINPGDTIIASSSNSLAAYNKKSGDIKIVALNSGSSDRAYTFDLSAFTNVGDTVTEIRTNNATGSNAEHWKPITGEATLTGKKLNTTLKAGTLTTYVVKGSGAVDYMTINGASTVVVGVDYNYTVSRGSQSTAPEVTWSVSDDTVASVTADGKVTAKKGGSFTLTATDKSDNAYISLDIQALSADHTIRIANKKSGLGLETKNKGITSGTQLVQWSDRGIDTAAWKLSATDDGHFNIINANNNMLLASSNGTLVISNSITDNNAKWDFVNHGGYYEVKNVGTNKSLNVSGQSTANGGSVILYTYEGNDNELWSFSEITGKLTHVEPVEIDYSEKYKGTDYEFVSNVESATNDFNDGDPKGFVFKNNAGLGSDSEGEAVLLPQNNIRTVSNAARSGDATLALSEPVTCGEGQLINLSFDMVMGNSAGESIFTLSASDGTDLVKIIGTDYGSKYSVNIGKKEIESSGDGTVYFRNSHGENTPSIKNGGHVEIYYRPSDGYIEVTVKNVTGNAEAKKYIGSAGARKNIGEIYFAGHYTAWNRIMAVDNLETNIIKYAEGVEPPVNNIAPTVNAYRSGSIIGYKSDYSVDDDYDMYIAVHDLHGTLVGIGTGTNGIFTLPDANGTYTVTEYLWDNMEPVIKPITITPEAVEDGYLFAHFKGEDLSNGEQIYFSVSTTAEDWHVLNNGQPVLTSTVGEKGVRDPYIMRTEDNKFVIIATDLKINGGNGWGAAQTAGSKSLVVWKSDDLVNWGNANLREVAVSNAGCTWAPEAIYDSAKQKYMVFWASMIDGKHSIYRTYTSDFESFEPAELYITEDFSVIDTTIIKNGNTYYRFNKNEATGQKYIYMEKSNDLSGIWEAVDTFNKNQTGYEGPTIFKVNGQNKWCLMLDAYGDGGYKPFFTENLTTGIFTDGNAVTYDGTYRHGTVLPITGGEYIRLITAY